MASLAQVVKENYDEIMDGIAWVVIYKHIESWVCSVFWIEDGNYDDGYIFSEEDVNEMKKISTIDQKAIAINGYYMPFGEDFTDQQIENTITYYYEGRINQLVGDFLGIMVVGT